jgi:dTDP-4-amino-4,6-dideoxygalactose transaminase
MREKIVKRYKKNLFEVKIIETQQKTHSSNHKFVILFDRRDELKAYLQTKGIETKIHYAKLLDNNRIGIYPDKIKEFFYV